MCIDKKNIFIEAFDKDKTYKGYKNFLCGNKDIDKYAVENLKRDGQRDNKIVYVMVEDIVSDDDTGTVHSYIKGFVTMHNFSFNPSSEVRDALRKGNFYEYSLPRLVSTLKISMIGVDKNYQKKPENWGSQVLTAALNKALEIANVSNDIKGVILDASPSAVDFYKRHRFVVLEEDSDENGAVLMFLSVHQLRDAMERANRLA